MPEWQAPLSCSCLCALLQRPSCSNTIDAGVTEAAVEKRVLCANGDANERPDDDDAVLCPAELLATVGARVETAVDSVVDGDVVGICVEMKMP